MQHTYSSRHRQKFVQAHRKRVHKLKLLSRHPFAIPVAVFFALLILSVGTYLLFFQETDKTSAQSDNRLVILSYDDQQRVVPASPQTVGELLKKLAIPIHEGDVVEPEKTTKIVQDNFRINIYRAVPVQVVGDDGTSKFAFSAATTARSIAAQAGVTVYPEDSVRAQPVTNFLKQGSVGEQVVVNRSLPVNLNLYGTAAPTRTLGKTVAAMLKEKNVKLIDGATVMPSPQTPLTAGMQVFVLAKGVSITSVEETVPMPEQNIDDNNLTLGSRAIRQAGAPGKQLVTYQIKVDPATGAEISRTVIQAVITQNPVPQIIAIGKNVAVPKDKASIMVAAGVRPSDYGYVDYIISHESGWCATKAQGHIGSCPPYAGFVPSGGGYGLCQSTPGSKMASAGADWQTNPVTQLHWCASYANSRYGSWSAAYNHWLSHHNW
jgi:uncharacterized protein YabE (DUF348 family)